MISALELLFLCTAGATALTAAGVFLLNPYRPINRIFVLALGAIAFWFFSIFMVLRETGTSSPNWHEMHVLWLRLGSAVMAILPWLGRMMMTAVTAPTLTFPSIVRHSWPWLIITAALGILTLSESFIPFNTYPHTPKRGFGYTIYFCVLLAQVFVLLIQGYRQMRALSGIRRIEMQLFVINTSVASLVVLLLAYFGRMLAIPLLSRSAPIIFIILYGVTLWTICSHRIFDARQVIISLAHRVIQVAMLGAVAITLTSILHPAVKWPYDILLAAVVTGILALISERPSRQLLGLDHDHRLTMPRRVVVSLARKESEAAKLKSAFETYLSDWCQAQHVVLMPAQDHTFSSAGLTIPNNWAGLGTLCREGWITPELLQRRKPEAGTKECSEFLTQHNLGALLAVPPGSDSPTLLLALGVKRGLRPYTYPDIRLLLNLTELMDNILTHANLALQAAKIARMEAAAMMSRSLAHDLSNLTMPVATYLLHAQDRAVPGTPEAEVYDAALQSVKVMHDYIRERLFFSQRLVPDLKEFDPAASLASTLRLSHDRANRRGITLKGNCRIMTRLTADPALFQRLAQNLVNNAIDASPQDTVVTINITDKEPGKICLSVSDQGPGIRPEHLHRIFDPYFTTKDTGSSMRGLGLGLAICQKITELHGGRIDVSSEWGKGATFTATFPADHTTAHPDWHSQGMPQPRPVAIYPRPLPHPA
jgi:signal transduction histidine kinase